MTILTPLHSSDPLASQSRKILVSIFQAVGRCRFLDEKHFDAATALAGSGPAFACVFLEAMADGAVMMGLPRKEALELAAQSELPPFLFVAYIITLDADNSRLLTFSTLQLCKAQHAWSLSQACTQLRSRTASLVSLAPSPISWSHHCIGSLGVFPHFYKFHLPLAPGGCTIAGLLNLEDGKVRSTVARTIQAAAEHASGLGQTSKK